MTFTPIQPTDPIIGPSRGTADGWIDWIGRHRSEVKRPDDVIAFIRAVYELCAPDTMPDAFIASAQSFHETGNYTSQWWAERLNPAGIGVTGDDTQNAASPTFATPMQAARAQIAHLLLYALGAIDRGGLKPSDDPRYLAYRDEYGSSVFPTLQLLSGRWAADSFYANKIADRQQAIYPMFSVPVEPPAGGTDVATKPLIILAAGHRNTSGGNEEEASWTPALLAAYEAAFTSAGYTVFPIQENDGDSNPTYTNGSLDVVTKIGANRMDSWAGDGVYLDLHYEGSPAPGVFCIVPDGVGLSSVVATPDADSFAGNPLDVALAKTIAGNISAVTGLQLRTSGVVVPGVMSEKQTGVGIDGYRLATMAYTARVRDRLVRLVVEHGNHMI